MNIFFVWEVAQGSGPSEFSHTGCVTKNRVSVLLDFVTMSFYHFFEFFLNDVANFNDVAVGKLR